eukprot:1058364_1
MSSSLNKSFSTTSPRDPTEFKYSEHDRDSLSHSNDLCTTFEKIGLMNATKITDTLQGCIYRGSNENEQSVVMKVTDQYLHAQSSAMVDGHTYHCAENVLVEQSILKYLTLCKDCPDSIVQFLLFFQTDREYVMVMEDGGCSLFSFIKKAHQLIESGKIEISHWKEVVRVIFKQMIECIDFIHSNNVAHFDISLENFLINDVNVEVRKPCFATGRNKETLRFILSDIQIKLCDFGLAKLFTTNDCRCSKFCGKQNYKSPEVVRRKKVFDAKKNDIWALGIVLFMMQTGIAPWNVASESDDCFVYIMECGQLVELIIQWEVLEYVDEAMFDLIASILQYEEHRIDLESIKKHPFVQ